MKERPKICCLDIDKSTIESLQESSFNIFDGSLGKKVKVKDAKFSKLLLNYDFPPNVHEYDIIIVDLDNEEIIDYCQDDHTRELHTGNTAGYFLSKYPETLFNPRPFSSHVFKKELSELKKRPHMVIAFATESYKLKYTIYNEGVNSSKSETPEIEIYSLLSDIDIAPAKFGTEVATCNGHYGLRLLLERYKKSISYKQTFHRRYIYSDSEKNSIPDPSFFPLMVNSHDEIISFMRFNNEQLLLVFPIIEEKKSFLKELLLTIAPDLMPHIFPNSKLSIWKDRKEYWLPNHGKLIMEKQDIETEFTKQLANITKRIEANYDEYSFLHSILTETDTELVKSIIKYLRWLDFENVIDVDDIKSNSEQLEEDIQIETENGLIIIECKGIGGTSTDSDCSQIHKIKFRRCKERNKFDVSAIYIVNHQRYLPPKDRENPPFTYNQIQDAINDERSLLTTWQLYNLYFDIDNDVITKQEARESLLKYGLINFKPHNLRKVDQTEEIFKNGFVCIVNITDTEINIGDELFIEKNGRFSKVIVLNLKANDTTVESYSNGELGIELDRPIKKNQSFGKGQLMNPLVNLLREEHRLFFPYQEISNSHLKTG